MARPPTRREIWNFRAMGLARWQIRERLRHRAASEENQRRERITAAWKGWRFHRRLTAAKAAYANAIHPCQRIEAWRIMTRMQAPVAESMMSDYLFHVPDEVINVRMMG